MSHLNFRAKTRKIVPSIMMIFGAKIQIFKELKICCTVFKITKNGSFEFSRQNVPKEF